MQIIKTEFEGLIEIIPNVYPDERGWFYEFYKEEAFKKAGINTTFVQENQSFSKKGVIRGLHLQLPPFAQAKLVTVISGKVLDVVVDLRKESKTFKKVYYCPLDSVTKKMLLVPEGFAHGFAALEDSIFFYKCSNFYDKKSEAGIVWDDTALNINWQTEDPIVSEKDNALITLKEFLGKSVISHL